VIGRVIIKNFKAFRECEIKFSKLTIIMGENGIGKSTIVQSILLSKQALVGSTEIPKNLYLNGPLVKIGNGADALRKNAEEEKIAVSIELMDGLLFEWSAAYVPGSDVLPMTVGDVSGIQSFRDSRIRYLSAERVGPQLTSPFSQSEASRSDIDERGANALGLLHFSSDMALDSDDPRVPSEAKSRSIQSIFNYYLSKISSGATVAVQDLSDIDSVSATFSFVLQGELPMERIRPTNVGFGLSYSASIIIMCLISKPGETIIIENPEAHLHTKGLRAILDLLVLTAEAGVQVICESHSREILYWTRRKVIESQVPSDLAIVNYVCSTDGHADKVVVPWYPLSKPLYELGPAAEDFLEHFGAPLDFQQLPTAS